MRDHVTRVCHTMSDVGHMMGGVGHTMSDVGHMMSDVGHMMGGIGHMMGGVGHMMVDVGHMMVDERCKNDGSYKHFLLTVLTESDCGWSLDIPARHCTKTMACLLPESIWNLIQ